MGKDIHRSYVAYGCHCSHFSTPILSAIQQMCVWFRKNGGCPGNLCGRKVQCNRVPSITANRTLHFAINLTSGREFDREIPISPVRVSSFPEVPQQSASELYAVHICSNVFQYCILIPYAQLAWSAADDGVRMVRKKKILAQSSGCRPQPMCSGHAKEARSSATHMVSCCMESERSRNSPCCSYTAVVLLACSRWS